MISPIDLGLGLVAVLTLVRVARRPHPVHPTTAILLTLLTGVLLWANLRDRGWHEVWNEDAPEGLDPVTKAMFYRGWPLAPFTFCRIQLMQFHPSGLEQCLLALDAVVFLAALSTTKAVCERILAWRRRRELGRIGPEFSAGSRPIACEVDSVKLGRDPAYTTTEVEATFERILPCS